jgi:hypothetical protein
MTKCNAIIMFGDDYGDNESTFHCELEAGHDGKHSETGVVREKMSYTLTWEGNLTMLDAICPNCGHEEEVESDTWEFYKESEGGYDCIYCPDGTMMVLVSTL